MMNRADIRIAASAGIEWLKNQRPTAVKDISRAVQALSIWDETPADLIEALLSEKKGAFWETDKPVTDTARACSALAVCGVMHSDALSWLLERQENGNWNNSEIDTSYALAALGDAGVKNDAGCEWLINCYGEEHIGTTSLIITALLKQDEKQYRFFIDDRAGWVLSKRLFGGWMHVATSNLAVQALLLAGERNIEKDIGPSVKWLLEKQKNGNWGGIVSTSLSLISLKMYLDRSV